MPPNEHDLREWLQKRINEANASGERVSLRSLARAARGKDLNWLAEWMRNARGASPSVQEWVLICRALRAVGVDARISHVLYYFGISEAELADELDSVAPYSDPVVGARVGPQIRQLSAEDLVMLEEFVGFLKYESKKRKGELPQQRQQ